MAYCNTTTDIKTRGAYVSKNVPNTLNLDVDEFVDMIADEIDAELSSVGVIVPVNTTTFPIAGRRLKHLNALGVNAEIQDAIATSTSALMSRENVSSGSYFRKLYRSRLNLFKENPRLALFAGEDDSLIASAFNSNQPVRPKSSVVWSYNAENVSDPTFTTDKEF